MTQVQTLVLLALNIMISAPILTIGGVIMALRQDVPLSGLLLVIIPAMFLLIGIVMSRAIPLFQALQKKLDQINLVMRETLSGVRVIRAFVRVRHEEERFDTVSRDLMDTSDWDAPYYERAAPFWQSYAGLKRWWEKQQG